MQNCEIQFFVNVILPYDEKGSLLSKSCYFGRKSPQILSDASRPSYLFTTQYLKNYIPATPNYQNSTFIALVEEMKLNKMCL